MKSIKKVISIFLAILTLFSICSVSTTVFAAEYTEQRARTEYFDSALSGYLKNIVDIEDAVSIAEKEQIDETIEEVQSSAVSMASTFSLRTASVQNVEETESVQDAVEDLDIDHTRLTLELEDGENVAYLFSEPVSFIDDEGNLVYKDTNINAVTDTVILNRGYSYENGDNDYKAYFSEDSSKGLLLIEKDGEEIRLVPNGTQSVGTVKQIESDMELVDSFEYAGVYGTDSVLRFLPQLNGCKEEIVLSSYQGISDFSFTLYTEEGTIAAINSNGEVEIIDSATKDIITTFVAPFANDSSGGMDVTSEHYTDCTYELEMISEGKYILTISVPEEYLESKSTVYPVIIDPTTDNISMTYDTSVYSALKDSPQNSNPTACFGKTSSSQYGKGRAMFYFKIPSDIEKYAKISSAKLWLRETTGRTETMYVRPYLIKDSWNNSVTWSTQPAYHSTCSYPTKSGLSLPRRNINSASTDKDGNPYLYAFNIIYAVKAWTTGTTNRGLMFIAECESSDGDYLWRGFATKEYTTSSYRPYAVIKYTNDVTPPEITYVEKDPDVTYTNKNVTVTVTATDNVYKEGGISKYSFNNGSSWQTSKEKIYKEEGTYTPKVIVKDLVTLESDMWPVPKFIIDKTAPKITSVKKSVTSEWANSNVKVTINASDELSGMNSNGYYFDSSKGWQTDNYKTYSAEGTYTVTPKARDKVPNTATASNVSVKIDKTAPSVKTPTKNPSSEWSNVNVTVTNNATDALSGIVSTKGYSFDNGSSWQNEKTKTYSTEGTYTVTPKAKDKATNEGTGSAISVKIDKTAPVVKLPTKKPSTEWSNTNVTVTNNATDALSGIASSKGYSFDNGSSWQDGKTKTYSTEGVYTITPKAKDKATNEGTGSAISVKIDKTAPAISKIEKSPSAEWSKGDVNVTVTASDALSGIAASNGYSFNNGTDWQTSNYKTYSNEGTYTVTAITKDKATNKSASKTITVKIDRTAPTATISGTISGDTVLVTVNANDALSGLCTNAYSFDNGNSWVESNTATLSANEISTIQIKDNAGNIKTIIYNPKLGTVVASPSLDVWTNSDVVLTVNGEAIQYYKFDSDDWDTNNSKSYTENTTANISVKDESDNDTSLEPISISNIDKEKPVISSLTSSVEEWCNQDITVTVDANDNGDSGIYAYSADNGNSWQDSNVFTFSELTEAKFLVKDNAGNSSEVLNKEILIDKEAPILDLTGGCDDWSNEPITIVADANDEGGSGIFGYSFDGGNTWITENCKVYEESTNEIASVIVKDNAGNITEKTAQVMVDIDAPAISDVALSSASWTKEDVTITVTASDVMSGLADTAYSFDGGSTWQIGNSLTVSENGTFNIIVKDNAGNETTWDEIVIDNIDKEAPSSPDLYEQDGLVYISSRSFDFNEETDSPEHIEYKIENGEWTEYDGEPINIVRTYGAKVYARVRDDAENISPIAEITLENALGEYTASYTDIALGEGLFPVEFGRTYTSTNGWFFTFDANVVKIDDNAYVFTDFYGEKQYFIKNDEGKYLSIDDEELTVNADSYVLTYGDMTCTFGILDGKINRITTDYLDTAYTWNDNGTLTVTGGATVTFTDGKPTKINITREGQVKEVDYVWTECNLTKFIDAADTEHIYAYTNGLLTTNDTEIITYSNGRVKLISQPNGAFVKYTYNDSAENAEAPNNVGAVTVNDSKGVTDTICYADGVYISNTLDSYSDKAIYAPNEISDAITTDAVSNIVYVVEEQGSGNNQNDEIIGSDETELPLYEAIDENAYAFYAYDNQKRVTAELKVLKTNISVDENTTFEQAEAVAEEKYTYFYDINDSIANKFVYQWIIDSWYQTYGEEYTYDNYGNVLSQITTVYTNTVNTETNLIETTSESNTAIYEYDVWCQQIKETNNAEAEDETVSETSYDVFGRTIAVVADGVTVSYTYDDKGNILTITKDEEITTYTYSDNGNLVSRTNPNGTVASYVYDSYGNLTNHEFNGYAFTYNTLGSILTASSESGEIVNYSYLNTVKQEVLTSNFGNGQSIVYDYNENGKITAVKLGEERKYGYEYFETTDENGEDTKEWVELTDYVSGFKKTIEANKTTVKDFNGNFIYSVESVLKDEEKIDSFDGEIIIIGENVYSLISDANKDTFKTNEIIDFIKEYTYVNNELINTDIASMKTVYSYDAKKLVSNYKNMINHISQAYSYVYDKNDNIITETLITTSTDENGATVETNEAIHYTYDDKEQLISAETPSIKYKYTYDDRGNILTKKEYSISLDENNQKVYTLIETNTDTYVYDETWKDKLISYNGQTITYDTVGNPTNYMGNVLTWTMGRQLSTFGNIRYTYNEDGIRTSKTNDNNTIYYYIDNNGNIIEQIDGITTLRFFYDSKQELLGFKYNDNIYLYIKNLQCDIVGIMQLDGTIVVEYKYDPWGNLTSINGNTVLGEINPFRYRSHYYDNETGLYYFKSRYYDAKIGRFINSDDYKCLVINDSEISYNTFAYCANSPINKCDFDGYSYAKLVGWGYYYALQVALLYGGTVVACFAVVAGVLVIVGYSVSYYKEHTSTKNGKKKNKHEKGNARRQRDQGGEKKKQKSDWKKRR